MRLLQFQLQSEKLHSVMDFVDATCREYAVVDETRSRTLILVEELVTNAIKHGCRREAPCRSTLSMENTGHGIRLLYEDNAQPFNPLQSLGDEPVPQTDVLKRPVGGQGLRIIQNLGNNAHYEFSGGLNRLSVEISILAVE